MVAFTSALLCIVLTVLLICVLRNRAMVRRARMSYVRHNDVELEPPQ